MTTWQALLRFENECDSYHHLVELTPEEALRFVDNCQQINCATNEVMSAMVTEINRLMPRMVYGPDNPNTGRFAHVYKIGQEYSRVIYVNLLKAYGALVNWENLVGELEKLPTMFPVDEFDVSLDNSWLTVRMWWD